MLQLRCLDRPLQWSANSAGTIRMRIAVIGASLFFLLCGQAMARPRDDVMAGAYRCAAQTATRAWLDCYYGAAHPQRAALGLSPAPAAQQQLMDAAPGTGPQQNVDIRDAVMAAAGRCIQVAQDRAWLDCYYAASNPARSLMGLA